MQRIDLAEALASFDEHWDPKVIAELNGQHVKLAKLLGPFVWHHHEHEDELFLVLSGRLRMEFRHGSVEIYTVEIDTGQMLVVPKGVEHRPVADEEVHVLLFEPSSTLNTGNVINERTVPEPEKI